MRSGLPLRSLPALLLIFPPARSLSAQQASGGLDLAVALRAGSPGIGLEVNKLLLRHLGVRVGGNYFRYSTTRTQSDIRYDATLKLRGVSALLDLYPGARGSFHFTGGLFTSPVKVTATGKPSAAGDFEINGNTYTASQVGTLDAEAKYSDVGPYFGLGFGTPANSHHGLVFLFDLGVVIGKAKVTMSATGAAGGSQLASDLAAQARKTQDDINEYAQVYPVLSFGLGYRF
jgi:hypothetical protein